MVVIPAFRAGYFSFVYMFRASIHFFHYPTFFNYIHFHLLLYCFNSFSLVCAHWPI